MYFFLNFLLINAAFIQPLWTLECYTCGRSGFCPELVNMDGGDESDENDADPIGYNDDFYCESDERLDPRTGKEKLILRGTQHCEEVNIPNHRRHCCQTNHCNKHRPPMTRQSFAETNPKKAPREDTSHAEQIYPSLLWIFVSIIVARGMPFI